MRKKNFWGIKKKIAFLGREEKKFKSFWDENRRALEETERKEKSFAGGRKKREELYRG